MRQSFKELTYFGLKWADFCSLQDTRPIRWKRIWHDIWTRDEEYFRDYHSDFRYRPDCPFTAKNQPLEGVYHRIYKQQNNPQNHAWIDIDYAWYEGLSQWLENFLPRIPEAARSSCEAWQVQYTLARVYTLLGLSMAQQTRGLELALHYFTKAEKIHQDWKKKELPAAEAQMRDKALAYTYYLHATTHESETPRDEAKRSFQEDHHNAYFYYREAATLYRQSGKLSETDKWFHEQCQSACYTYDWYQEIAEQKRAEKEALLTPVSIECSPVKAPATPVQPSVSAPAAAQTISPITSPLRTPSNSTTTPIDADAAMAKLMKGIGDAIKASISPLCSPVAIAHTPHRPKETPPTAKKPTPCGGIIFTTEPDIITPHVTPQKPTTANGDLPVGSPRGKTTGPSAGRGAKRSISALLEAAAYDGEPDNALRSERPSQAARIELRRESNARAFRQ